MMPLKKHTYAVIMAGGAGTRFVPYSTPEKPKQFLPVTHPTRTMIQETYERVSALVPAENCLISTNERYISLVREQLPKIPSANIVGEPLMKNTAPAIALMAALISSRNKDAIMAVMPSDHYIEKSDVFVERLKCAIKLADTTENLVTLGIVPTHPSTGYGYIKRGPEDSKGAYSAERFVEKPDREKAEEYIRDGGYYWNSGMFVWRVDVFMRELKNHAPEIASLMGKLNTSAREFFEAVPSISIDYALMEKTDRICVIPLDAGWSDVGSWEIVSELIRAGKIDPPAEILPYLSRKG